MHEPQVDFLVGSFEVGTVIVMFLRSPEVGELGGTLADEEETREVHLLHMP